MIDHHPIGGVYAPISGASIALAPSISKVSLRVLKEQHIKAYTDYKMYADQVYIALKAQNHCIELMKEYSLELNNRKTSVNEAKRLLDVTEDSVGAKLVYLIWISDILTSRIRPILLFD